MNYPKLSPELTIMSTVWLEPSHVRIVWITLLLLRDRRDEVRASVPGLAHAARVTRAECEDAIRILSAPDPDPDARSKAEDGRRILPVAGGWFLVNGKQSADERRKKKTSYMRYYRQRVASRIRASE